VTNLSWSGNFQKRQDKTPFLAGTIFADIPKPRQICRGSEYSDPGIKNLYPLSTWIFRLGTGFAYREGTGA